MPSELHNWLAERSLRWLRQRVTARGLRGGFEVPIADTYIADAVALCCFKDRFARKYIGRDNFREVAGVYIIPELACVFEAKATRSDFLATFVGTARHANRRCPVGSLHWAVCGRNVCEAEELPDIWGLLQVRGAGLTEQRQPRYCPQSPATLNRTAYQILWYAKNTAAQTPGTNALYESLEH